MDTGSFLLILNITISSNQAPAASPFLFNFFIPGSQDRGHPCSVGGAVAGAATAGGAAAVVHHVVGGAAAVVHVATGARSRSGQGRAATGARSRSGQGRAATGAFSSPTELGPS